jgi:hypothetical protein
MEEIKMEQKEIRMEEIKMEQKEISLDDFLRLLYPVPKNQDGKCPFIDWIGLGHGSGIGEWKCRLQSYQYGDIQHGPGTENTDYNPCDCSNHKICPYYLKKEYSC